MTDMPGHERWWQHALTFPTPIVVHRALVDCAKIPSSPAVPRGWYRGPRPQVGHGFVRVSIVAAQPVKITVTGTMLSAS